MEGFLTDYPAGDVDSHNIIYSWCAQTQVSMHSCEFTSGYCREREIDRILLCTISNDDIPEGVTGKEILTSCVPVYVTKYEGQRSPIWLKNSCQELKFHEDPESRTRIVISYRKSPIINGNEQEIIPGKTAETAAAS